ncbi:MAG: hypothetical protein JO148_06985 [Acidimicrobiia bacterium]|nr:hypothetical protein [Acidimicrobiia bacterium]
MQAWTTARNATLRGPLTPGPAVAERRAADVLPAEHTPHRHGAMAWTAALVASVARTGWLAAVTTLAFVAGAFGATYFGDHSMGAAVPWILIGGGLWLLVAATWAFIRRR